MILQQHNKQLETSCHSDNWPTCGIDCNFSASTLPLVFADLRLSPIEPVFRLFPTFGAMMMAKLNVALRCPHTLSQCGKKRNWITCKGQKNDLQWWRKLRKDFFHSRFTQAVQRISSFAHRLWIWHRVVNLSLKPPLIEVVKLNCWLYFKLKSMQLVFELIISWSLARVKT